MIWLPRAWSSVSRNQGMTQERITNGGEREFAGTPQALGGALSLVSCQPFGPRTCHQSFGREHFQCPPASAGACAESLHGVVGRGFL